MKEFLQIFRRFVPPYKRYVALTVVFNLLSAFLNIFSFLFINRRMMSKISFSHTFFFS